MADEQQNPDQPEQPEQIAQISIEPRTQIGVWSNFARVSHSEHEFTIDFIRMDFANRPVTGIVAARVAVSPLFITQLIKTLQDNWEKYARKAMPKEVYGDDDPE